MEQFHRQIILPNFGLAAQQKLKNASVLVVGVGGLGCSAVTFLTAAGVGKIGIIDFDVVTQSNLNRQIIFGLPHLGLPKAQVAANYLVSNYGCNAIAYHQKLDASNCFEIFNHFDVIIDCTDVMATRYLINDTCLVLNKPWVYAAVYRNQAQLASFNVQTPQGYSANYRHLFNQPNQPVTCNEAGILGTVTGVAGALQAQEAIKMITLWKTPIINQLALIDVVDLSIYKINIEPVEIFAPTQMAQWNEIYVKQTISEITYDQAIEMGSALWWMDVRELDELPPFASNQQYPLSMIPNISQQQLAGKNHVLLFCNTGVRSFEAAKMLKEKFPDINVYSLQGGLRNIVQ